MNTEEHMRMVKYDESCEQEEGTDDMGVKGGL